MTDWFDHQPSIAVDGVFGSSGRLELRLSGGPRDWARWLDVLTPGAFQTLMMLQEPVDDAAEFAADEDWAVTTAVSRGLSETVVRAGVTELRSKGYLAHPPRSMTEVFCTPQKPPPPPRPPRLPLPMCSVCGGTRPHNTEGLSTYVVRRGGYLKIGVSRNVPRRLAALSSPHPGVLVPNDFDWHDPLVFLGTSPIAEHDLHERFAGHHAAGEWFHDSPSLRRALTHVAGVT